MQETAAVETSKISREEYRRGRLEGQEDLFKAVLHIIQSQAQEANVKGFWTKGVVLERLIHDLKLLRKPKLPNYRDLT